MSKALASAALLAVIPLGARADLLTLRDGDRLLTTADRATWVDRARCLCGEALSVTVELSSLATGARAALVAGQRCVTSEARISDSCTVLWEGEVGSDTTEVVDVAADRLAPGCDEASTTALALLADDADTDEWRSVGELALTVDTVAPAAPPSGQLVAGEGLVEVAWEASEDDDDVARYQVLCATSSGAPALETPPDAAFDAPWDRCAPEGEDASLSAAFVCADAVSGADSVTVLGLTDQVRYSFAVVAIDASGNASARRALGTAVPSAEEDLWERYLRAGGTADGGGCAAIDPGTWGVWGVLAVLLARGVRR